MLLFWGIRYLDSRDKRFKDRNVWLQTDSLDPVTKAAVELCHELSEPGFQRRMLQYRRLFRERDFSDDELNDLCARHGGMSTGCIPGYFEDENGNEMTSRQMGAILTGNPNLFPAGVKRYQIDYALADKGPIPVDQISLSQDRLDILGRFTRDLWEMLSSAFYKDGPGTLTGRGENDPILKTGATDEEIRSFVMIFRRLYMKKEPANFLKAVAVFSEALQGHPLAGLVSGIAYEYKAELHNKPDSVPFVEPGNLPFTRKRLIDVVLYTEYLHQDDARRKGQRKECLAAVGNKRPLLTWVFLTEIWKCALHMRNAGAVIEEFLAQYCQCHQECPDVIASVYSENPGIGALEKKHSRQERVFEEKAEELAQRLWEEQGRPLGGAGKFLDQAREQLRNRME